jgi:hypothetical protein
MSTSWTRSVRFALARIAGVGLCTAAGIGIGGCGGEPSNITRTGSTVLEQRADGSLTRQPDPLSVADLERVPPGSPQATVLRLWFYGQWGSAVNAVRFYDQRVLRAIGHSSAVGAYASQRLGMLDSHPKVRSVTRNPAGTLVKVDMLTISGAPRREFFLLRRQGAGWRIVYDSFLDSALATYVEAQMRPGTAPPNAAASRDAIAARIDAVNRYRSTLLSDLSAARAAGLR